MPIYNPDDNEKDDDALQELNLVLIEYSVFTNSMTERRKLLVPLLEAGVTPEQLRMVCAHIEKYDAGNTAAQVTLAIRDDPQLRAPLHAAVKTAQRRGAKPAPGERDRRENMEREALNPDGERQRRAMYAYCAITHKEVASTAELATRLEVSVTEAEELVEHGRRVYAGEES